MTGNALSILIVIFSIQLQQTEISERKLFIFHLGQRVPLLFFYEVSIVVLIDFIAILLTPGNFLIQIVNTNMYLIHFHKNIIKMRFPKVGFLKFQTYLNRSLPITTWSHSEIVLQEQSYSSLHSGRSLAWDYFCGDIDDPCGIIA